jgi:hypothetical protein
MSRLKEAAQQAEAVLRGCLEHPDAADAIAALHAALAEHYCDTHCTWLDHAKGCDRAEPVTWGMPRPDGAIIDVICPEEHARMPGQYTVPLYAAPQPRKRLTNQEILDIGEKAEAVEGQHMLPVTFARAIEAAVWGEQHGS